MINKKQTIFMVGVGGMGMAPLAVYLSKIGNTVHGFDDSLSEQVREILDRSGVIISSNLDGLESGDLLVYSSAISQTHPMLIRARKAGIQIIKRGSMLAKQAEGKRLVAVVGSHGKTTTAHMLAHLLNARGFPANFIGGGLFNDENLDPAWSANSDWLVAEVDESDGGIEEVSPEITLLTNLDWDHPDFYRSEDELREAFGRLFTRTTGQLLLPYSQAEHLIHILPEADVNVHLFGEQGDYEIESNTEVETGTELRLCGRFSDKSVNVATRGKFNLQNALAALALGHSMGLREFSDGLSDFSGINRRQSVLYDSIKLSVIADYAHHPTEISALLDATSEWYPNRRKVVVFQPHRYSRTAQFREAFARELNNADQLVVLPVYSAGESHQDEGDLGSLRQLMPDAEFLYWLPGHTRLKRMLKEQDKPSVILFIGAGSIEKPARLFGAICRNNGSVEKEWLEYLRPQLSPNGRLRTGESLHNKTTLKIGGKAKFYAEPDSMEDLLQLLESAAMFGLPHYILGRGSNLIVSDEGFPGIIIRLSRPFWRSVNVLKSGQIRVGGGARLGEVANRACACGISGFEFLEGIPGSIGGALKMNAGAMGSWIFDFVEEVTVMNDRGQIELLSREVFRPGYRRCTGLEDRLALCAILESPVEDTPDAIRSRMRSFAKRRRSTQPRESSAGCIFRNPEGYYAGQLIDDVGLKGKRIGGAEVSSVHGNFIVNVGDARYGDVAELVRTVRKEVWSAHKLELFPEVELLGTNWDKTL